MSIANQLSEYRQYVEKETGKPVSEIELPLHMVLDDLCTFLKLKNGFRRQILGGESEAVLQRYRALRVLKPSSKPRSMSKKPLTAKRKSQ